MTASIQTQDKPLAPSGPVKTKRELKDWLQGEIFQRELASLLPRTMSPERFVRIAFQALYRNPDLAKCNQESFFNCLLQLGAMGLEPDGRNAHLIPFKDECTLIVDYKGIAELLRRNHDVASIHCDVVYTADQYEAEQGTNAHLRHVKAIGERGTPLLAYSFVRLPDGSQEFEEMSILEVERIRKRSKSPNKGPWATDWNEMAKKTVFRRHAKTLPLSPATRDALERDHDGDGLAEGVQMVSANVVASGERKRLRKTMEVESEPENGQSAASDLASGSTESPAGASLGVKGDSAADEVAQAILGHAELVKEVSAKLLSSGYAEAELLAVLQAVRLIDPDADKLANCSNHALSMVMEQWDNAERRMREARTQAQKA